MSAERKVDYEPPYWLGGALLVLWLIVMAIVLSAIVFLIVS